MFHEVILWFIFSTANLTLLVNETNFSIVDEMSSSNFAVYQVQEQQPIYTGLQYQGRQMQHQKRISQCWRCFEKQLKKSLMKGVKGVLNQQFQPR
jgi:hypothetical protein